MENAAVKWWMDDKWKIRKVNWWEVKSRVKGKRRETAVWYARSRPERKESKKNKVNGCMLPPNMLAYLERKGWGRRIGKLKGLTVLKSLPMCSREVNRREWKVMYSKCRWNEYIYNEYWRKYIERIHKLEGKILQTIKKHTRIRHTKDKGEYVKKDKEIGRREMKKITYTTKEQKKKKKKGKS